MDSLTTDCFVPTRFFSSIKYYVIGDINDQTEKLLLQGGAQKHQYLSEILTHCIADKFDEEVIEAKELFQLDVVKSLWVTQSLKCKCFLPSKVFDADSSKHFFTGIVVCPSQMNRKDHQLIWGLITIHGGEYKTKYDASVTHLVTNSPSGKKYESACNSNVKVVCPLWVLSCVSQKKLMIESQFHPKHFTFDSVCETTTTSDELTSDKTSHEPHLSTTVTTSEVPDASFQTHILPLFLHKPCQISNLETFNSNPFISETSLNPCPTIHSKSEHPEVLYYGYNPSGTMPSDSCFCGCVFFITDYPKELGKNETDLWKQVIERYGGRVDDFYSDHVTHVICEHQKSDIFQLALKDHKRLVTACWLNDCLVEKQMLVPSSILHVPHPFGNGKPCFNQIICITNFSGSERIHIKKVILLLGGKYTGCLTRVNSVLVANEPSGYKYNKAVEWKIPVVNVNWLFELVLGNWDVLKLPVPRQFTSFERKGFPQVPINKISYLLEGWKTPLKVPKDKPKNFQMFEKSSSTSFLINFEISCKPNSKQKENLALR